MNRWHLFFFLNFLTALAYGQAPVNDDPCNAIALTVGATCNFTQYTNANATASSNVPAPGCASYLGGDVWFRIVVPASGAVNINTNTGVMTDGGMAIYSGSCNSLTLLACDDDNSPNGLMPMINATGLTPGSTIFIRIWSYSGLYNGTFRICASIPPPPPAGDDPCNALPLAVGTSCSFSTYNTAGMSPTTAAPAPGCSYIGYNDMWFQVVVPPSGNLSLNSLPGAVTDCGMAVYGGICNGLSLIRCNDDSGTLNMPMMSLTGLSPGSTVYVRFWAYSNTATNFGICATSPSLAPSCNSSTQAGNTCATATPICNFLGYCGNTYTYTPDASAAVSSLFNTCVGGFIGGATIENDSYISFVASDTTASFNVWVTSSTSGNGLQMMFFDGNCNGPVNCHGGYNTIYGSNFPNLITATGLIPGQTYYLLVDGYAGDDCNYTLDPVDGVNILDLTAAPSTTICLGGSVNLTATGGNGTYSWTPSTGLSATTGASVNASPTVTTTYSVTSGTVSNCNVGTLTRNITVTVLDSLYPPVTAPVSYCQGASALPLTAQGTGLTWYTTSSGGVGSSTAPIPSTLTVGTTTYYVSQSNASCGEGSRAPLTVTISPQPLAPLVTSPVVYCQNATASALTAQGSNLNWYSSASGGTGSSISPVPSTSNPGTTTYYVSQTINGCEGPRAAINVTVNAPVIPLFNPIGPFCRGTFFALSAASTNGISGTWSPAIDTTRNQTYTFTPAAGQCASTATLRVIVNQPSSSTTRTSVCANQLPYVWNNQSYGAAGTYSVAFLNAVGCDSTANLILTVKQVTGSNTPVSICSNNLPYVWNGQSYNAVGTYSGPTLINAAGCDSVPTLTLSIRNPTSSTTPVTTCATALPYVWNGQSYSSAGTYSVKLVNAAGCDSVAYLNLNVANYTQSVTSAGICSAALPFIWNGQSYTATGTYTAQLLNAANCDSFAIVKLTVNAPSSSQTIADICSSLLPYSWNGNAYASSGIYSVHFTNAAGCDSTAYLNLNVRNLTNSQSTVSICDSYSWNGITYTSSGYYSALFTNAAGCDSTAYLNLTILRRSTSLTAEDVCDNYSWNGNVFTQSGIYTASGFTNAAGCDSIAYLDLTVRRKSSSLTTEDVCDSYSWNGNVFTQSGSYTAGGFINVAGCDSTAYLNLTVRRKSSSLTTEDVCDSYSWNGNVYTQSGAYTAGGFINAAGCDSIAYLDLTVRHKTTSLTADDVCDSYSWNGNVYTQSGSYTATGFTNAAGCDSTAYLDLIVRRKNSSLTTDDVCDSYSWNGNVFTQSGSYTAGGFINVAGCDSTAYLNLTVRRKNSSLTTEDVCDSYSWNGNVYTQSGSYTAGGFINAAGCDSIAYLDLTVRHKTTSLTADDVCDSYSWNGNVYTQSGSYTATGFTNAAGCDSIAYLDLTVRRKSSSLTTDDVCDSYSWNGNIYTQSGYYTAGGFINAAGCDSTAFLNLTIRRKSSSLTTDDVCDSYSWNGNIYTLSGAYTASGFTNAVGCDSTAYLSLTVRQRSLSLTVDSACSSYLWNGTAYSQSGSYTMSGLINAAGCDSTAVLQLIIKQPTSSRDSVVICSNSLPYFWNGQSYAASGDYSAYFTNAAGCDSIAHLYLVINNYSTANADTSFCPAQFPVSWNGMVITGTGNYLDTLMGSTGCDSIVTWRVSLKNNSTGQSNRAICFTQLPYIWHGQSYNTAGVYTFRLSNAAGCDSTDILNLSINSYTSSTLDTSLCRSQLPYIWNGLVCDSTKTYKDTLVGSSGCDSIAILNLTVKSGTYNITSNTSCGAFSWNGSSYTGSGTYIHPYVNAAGCPSADTLYLVVNSGTFTILRDTACGSYVWHGTTYTSSGRYLFNYQNAFNCSSTDTLDLTVFNGTSRDTTVTSCGPYDWNGNTYSSTGVYAFNYVNAFGCSSTDILTLTVNSGDFNSITQSACQYFDWNGITYTLSGTYVRNYVNAAGCPSADTLHLAVSNGGPIVTTTTACNSFQWNGVNYTSSGSYVYQYPPNSGCLTADTLHLTVNYGSFRATPASACGSYSWNGSVYTLSGNYVRNYINASGCPSADTLNLQIDPIPPAPVVTSPISYCKGEVAGPLTASGIGQLLWYNSPFGGVGNSQAPVPSTSSLTTSFYYVSQILGNCEGPRVPIVVRINPRPSLGIDRDIHLCYGRYLNLDALYNTDGLSAIWLYNQQIVSNPSGVNEPGVYYLYAVNSAGCKDTAKVQLSLQPPVIADAGPDDTTDYLTPYRLHGSGGGIYLWTPGSPLLNNPYLSSPVAVLAQTTPFILMVQDEIGCSDYDTVVIYVRLGDDFYVPNAFTPNGDGLNDYFSPVPLGGIAELEYFRVFNRWGQQVFEMASSNGFAYTNLSSRGWDGRYLNRPQDPGNYVWELKGKNRRGEAKFLKGNVILIR